MPLDPRIPPFRPVSDSRPRAPRLPRSPTALPGAHALLPAAVALLLAIATPASAFASGSAAIEGGAGPLGAEPVRAQTTPPPEMLQPDLEAASRPNRALQLTLGLLAGALVGGGGAVAVYQTTQADCADDLQCDLESRAWTVGAATLGWTLGAAWGVWLGGLSGDWRGSFALTLLSALGGVVLGSGVTVALTLLESTLAVPAAVVGGLVMPLGAAYLGYRASERPPWPGTGDGPEDGPGDGPGDGLGDGGRIDAVPGGVVVRFF